jgi:cytoplasmic iron level regulating protein YaaA (DUF328/UPF0246 family)
MLAILSPAKSLDFETPPVTRKHTTPDFLSESQSLIEELRQFSPADISKLMRISVKLGDLNYRRYAQWATPFSPKNAKQAALAFSGDVYMGLEGWNFDARDFNFAQQHLRILSGLYGLLRPLDLIQPYRLEMGTGLPTVKGSDLYAFWGDKLTRSVNEAIADQGQPILVNLASNEYFAALQPDAIDARIITPTFRDLKNGRYKFLSFFAKRARGLMASYLIKERVKTVKALKAFDCAGYRYSEEQSRGDNWVFLRDRPAWQHAHR